MYSQEVHTLGCACLLFDDVLTKSRAGGVLLAIISL